MGPELTGHVIAGRYRLDAKIGDGGFGAVYRATDVQMGTDVAVKVMHDALSIDPNASKRFVLEARRTAALHHPNTVSVFDFGETDDGLLYLVMEFLDGRSLGSVLRSDGPLAPERAVHILDQALRALDAAHTQGVVHRDMKPDNVFLVPMGDDPDFVKLLDFGIAKTADQVGHLTATGVLVGTPAYMSPEQCAGHELDGRSDLYGLGCVAFTMLTGRPPFDAPTPIACLVAHAQETPVDVREAAPAGVSIPHALATWVARLLSKRPDDRYATANKARRALLSALTPSTTFEHLPKARPKVAQRSAPADVDTGNVGVTQVDTLPRPRSLLYWALGFGLAGAATAAILAVSGPASETAVPQTIAAVPSPPARGPEPVTRQPAAATSTTPAPPSPSPRIAAPTAPSPTPAPSPRRIRVRITSVPEGATLRLGGRAAGTTPMEATWTSGRKPSAAELVLDGYAPAPLSLDDADDGTTKSIVLTPKSSSVGADQPP